ncbi:MAG: glycosyltransferase family 2 protein [Chloroflexi bacterium]|nr:glycosyltransferase family 2 protein [Chloroflexota bacterium]
MNTPFLSIVIPAHNEETRLPPSLEEIDRFLRTQDFSAEVIIVENGSHDRTFDIALECARDYEYLKVIRSPDNLRGKGLAVKQGMLAAAGKWRFICDADLSMRIDDLVQFLPPATKGFDIVIASREAPGAVRVEEPEYRHLMGRINNFIIKLAAINEYEDTQCGFKMFSAEAATDLFEVQRMNGIGFDVELLYIAKKRGYKVKEVPITWYYDPYSTMRLWDDSIHMLREIWEIRRNWRRGCYARPTASSKDS